jgi:hypothetical protein
METINGGQIEKLLEDISSIKSVINKNKPLLQQVLNPAYFRLFTLLAAISIIGFCLLIYFLMQHYGNFSSIPRTTRYIIFNTIPAPISLSITLGYGLLIFSALGCFAVRADKEE